MDEPATTSHADASAPSRGEHEFGVQENAVFRELGNALGFVGVASVVIGALQAVFFVVTSVLHFLHRGHLNVSTLYVLLQGGLLLVTGVWLIIAGAVLLGAARSIDLIVTTEGNDVANLMHAMEHLKKVYVLQRKLFTIVIVLAAIALVALPVLALMRHF